MRLIKIIIPLILMAFTFSCKKDSKHESCAAGHYFPTLDTLYRGAARQHWTRNGLETALLGNWQLIRIVHYPNTPGSEADVCPHVKLNFSKNGIASVLRNDTLLSSGPFSIDSSVNYISGSTYVPVCSLQFENSSGYVFGSFGLYGNYMVTGNYGGDGADFYYERIVE